MPRDTDKLLKQASGILGATAQYILDTQPRLDSYAKRDAEFSKKAEETVNFLVGRGLLTKADAKTAAEKFAENPSSAFDFVRSLAKRIGPEEMGKAASADVQRAAQPSSDPWVELLRQEDGNTNTASLD